MKNRILSALAAACLAPIAAFSQTWVGSPTNNGFNTATNWNPASVPAANSDLVFSTTTNTSVGFNLPYTANSITFGNSGATPPAFFINGNGGTLTIAAGLGTGITTMSGSGGAVFNSSVSIALGANQVWSTDASLTVNSAVSGGFSLVKTGSSSLTLSGNNTFSGGLTVSAGSLYLSQSNSAGSAAISIGASGTLGTSSSDVSLANSTVLASGATVGGSSGGSGAEIDFNGAVTIASTSMTLNLGHGDVNFTNSLGAASSTALTLHSSGGNGAAILTGTTSNISSVVADNAALAIGTSTALTNIGSIAATNGGYVSAAYAGVSSPSAADVVAKIASPSTFDGTLGFDTADNINAPHVYDLTGLNLASFTNSNFALGTATNAVLTGAISTPQQDYHFRGFGDHGGGFFVQSNLADKNATTSNIIVTSPNSGGAVAGGIYVILQGDNSGLSGSLSVTDSAVILDSATALPSKDFSLAANSYAGYTETATGVAAYTSFADFAAHATSYDSAGGTSVLGLDSHGPLADFASGGSGSASRTVSLAADGDINLSTNFTKIYLGTVSGVTIASDVTITAPLDGVLRLVNMGGDIGNFNINAPLNSGNVTSVVVGMDGSEGVVALNAASNYTGGTTLKGGTLLVGNDRALGLTSSGLTVSSSISGAKFGLGASSNGILLDNAIAVTGNLSIGQGYVDEMDSTVFHSDSNLLTLSGAISGSGRLFITGATTLSGNNTYSGGTYIEADTTVSSNAGLGTNFVDLAYGRTLTFTAASPTVGGLADAGQFIFNAGTGTINFSGTSSFTVNQNSTTTYSGSFTGSTPTLTKAGTGTLFLTGANAGKFSSTTVTGGALSIGNGQVTGVSFDGNVTLSGGALNFQPASGQTITYSGSISGSSGSVSINGNSTGNVNVTGVGGSSFTGNTNVNTGTLTISADNAWSSASATSLTSGASVALQLNGSQTFKNLSGSGKINLASGKSLTVNSTSGTTLSGVISGSGNLVKTGSSSLTLTATNTYTGSTTIGGGTLILGSGSALATQSQIILDGGTLALGAFSPPTFANGLAVTANSFIDFGGGNDTLAFGDSSAANWAGTVTLSNFTVGSDFLRFGSSAAGLNGTELGQIILAGYTATGLDGSGHVLFTPTAVPEPATYAMFAGLAGLALAAWRRRRAKAA